MKPPFCLFRLGLRSAGTFSWTPDLVNGIMFVNGHAGNTPHFIRRVLEYQNTSAVQNRTPRLDLQSEEGASCAETDKQNVSLVTTSNRAGILFEICTRLGLYEY